MIDLGTKVFYRSGAADGSVVSIAFVTAAADDVTVGLAVKPDQAAWFDRPSVKLLGSEELETECWSSWPFA